MSFRNARSSSWYVLFAGCEDTLHVTSVPVADRYMASSWNMYRWTRYSIALSAGCAGNVDFHSKLGCRALLPFAVIICVFVLFMVSAFLCDVMFLPFIYISDVFNIERLSVRFSCRFDCHSVETFIVELGYFLLV